MTTARLSPAASLLRNSKLFALPGSIPLPPAKPSSETVPWSNSATSIYPTEAAIQTPREAQRIGEWGLKRALPLRSTAKNSAHTIRLKRGLDTAEHVTDFESAADHVVNLQKWDQLHFRMSTQPTDGPSRSNNEKNVRSVFDPSNDNTTVLPERISKLITPSTKSNLPQHLRDSLKEFRQAKVEEAKAAGKSPQQPSPEPQISKEKLRRWRYDGPWLAGMTDIQFDAYLKTLSDGTVERFRSHVKKSLLTQKRQELQKITSERTEAPSSAEIDAVEVTDEEVTQYIRELRSSPNSFGPEIAAFLDLPYGPSPANMNTNNLSNRGELEWKYNESTAASQNYWAIGPPRTHPSAGFSYVQNQRIVRNDAVNGPMVSPLAVPARVLKEYKGATQQKRNQRVGIGGVVGRLEMYRGANTQDDSRWTPKPGGTKTVVSIKDVSVQQNGALEVTTERYTNHTLDDQEVPYNKQDRRSAPAILGNPSTSRDDLYPPRQSQSNLTDEAREVFNKPW